MVPTQTLLPLFLHACTHTQSPTHTHTNPQMKFSFLKMSVSQQMLICNDRLLFFSEQTFDVELSELQLLLVVLQ